MLKQSLQLKLQQKLSPQQIKLMKLIQLPTIELEDKVKEELEENPALDEGLEDLEKLEFEDYEEREDCRIEADEINVDDYLSEDEVPHYRLMANNYSADDEEKSIPVAMGVSFTEILEAQLGLCPLNEDEHRIGAYLVGCINDNGYIRREISAIVDDLAFNQNIICTEQEIVSVLEVIQDFDPPGIAARNLQECLLIQLRRKTETLYTELALKIVKSHFNELSKKHYDKLISRLGINKETLRAVVAEVSKLNPKPGTALFTSTRIVQHIIPDFSITICDGELELNMNVGNVPELKVNKSFQEMLQTYKEHGGKQDKGQKDAVLFVKQKLDAAKWFIDAIKQRHRTLMLTMTSIMDFQEEYFLTGDERCLKPMILKDIAEKVNMDISTVSRVANSKYVDTPYGIFLIKAFFSESMKNVKGEDVSTKEIKKILEEVLSVEDKHKPLTDACLMEILIEKGYPIARRTVAKYREQLNISVARLRKEI